MWRWLACAAVVVLAACGSGDPLKDDPQGREACDQLVIAREHSEELDIRVGAMLAAGKAAAKAEDKAIRASVGEPVEGLEEFPVVDGDALEAACEDAGVDVPAAG